MSKPILFLFNGKVARVGSSVLGTIPPEVYTVTIDTVTHGSITASPVSGVSGTTITLTGTPDTGYELDYFTVNGVAIVGNTFTMPAENVTVGAVFKEEALPFNTVKIGNQIWSDYLTIDDGGTGIYIVTNPTGSITIPGTYYYYNGGAISRIEQAFASKGWRIPTESDWNTLYEYAGNDILKLISNYGWRSGGNGTDNYGFCLLPLGMYSESKTYYVNQYGYIYSTVAKSIRVSYKGTVDTYSSLGYYPVPLRLVKDA